MKFPQRYVWLPAVLLTPLAAACVAQEGTPPPTTPAPAEAAASGSLRRHALLIGCTEYPNLSEDLWLNGPTNDVALVTKLLKKRFRFTDDEIITLVHKAPEDQRPTTANIAREFAALADRAAAGDIVFIFLAGHGSQLDNDNPDDPNDNERDGKDEVFLPEDTKAYSLSTPAVGAIRDDQLGAWLDAIRARKADVFFVADTCHSGSMDRGAPETTLVRQRWIPPDLLNPPEETDAASLPGDAPPDDPAGPLGVADTAEKDPGALGKLIALYAVTDSATETEESMPPHETTDGPVYGRLAYALSEVLTRARSHLTYLELAQQIGWKYQGWDWTAYGMLTGSESAYHDEVLGKQSWRDRSSILLQRGEYDLSLDVGYLHGATIGSIYCVFPPVGSEVENVAAGYVKVTELTPTTARVETCAFGDDAAETQFEQLPERGRCELVYLAASSLKLTVAVAEAPFDPPPTDALARTEAIVRELAESPGSLIKVAGGNEAPDAYVLVGAKGAYFRRAADAQLELALAKVGPPPAGANDDEEFDSDVYGPFTADATPGSEFDQALDAIAKATNIRRLAESGEMMVIGEPKFPSVVLKVTVERLVDPERDKWEVIDSKLPLDAYDKNQLRVTVKNDSEAEVDVTILYIDSSFAITSYLPTNYQVSVGTDDNRIAKGQSKSQVFKITACPLGLEDVIIIATLTTPTTPRRNFVFLQQKGLERGTDRGGAQDTPLGQLLAMAAFGSGDRGGNLSPEIARYAMHRLSWTVRETPPAGE